MTGEKALWRKTQTKKQTQVQVYITTFEKLGLVLTPLKNTVCIMHISVCNCYVLQEDFVSYMASQQFISDTLTDINKRFFVCVWLYQCSATRGHNLSTNDGTSYSKCDHLINYSAVNPLSLSLHTIRTDPLSPAGAPVCVTCWLAGLWCRSEGGGGEAGGSANQSACRRLGSHVNCCGCGS